MRICLISREYPPDTGWGGIATFVFHLAHGLKEIGHDVEVVSLANDCEKVVEQDGIKVHRVLPYNFTGDLIPLNLCMPYSCSVIKASTALWDKFLKLHLEKPFDVIDTPELLAEGLFPAATKIAPLVIRLYTPHSKFIAENFHNVTATFDHRMVAILERVAMLKADILTSPSKDLADFVSGDLNYDRNKIRIIRNPIDINVFNPDGPKTIKSGENMTVLFVGRLEGRKGIHYLIDSVPDVVKAFPNARFIVLGSDTKTGAGQQSVLAELKTSLKRSNCTNHVEFISRVALEELPSYYRSADLCVVPSLYDNSPYTCLEAMACGAAIVGTTAGGIPEYIVDGHSGVLVPPQNKEALSSAIIKLLANKEERIRLEANARQRVIENFQRTEIARQTVSLYEEAKQVFASNSKSGLYLKDVREAQNDAETFLYSFNNAIGDFLYMHSWRFRLRYWMDMRKRPKLLSAKVFLALCTLISKLTGKTITSSKIEKLREETKVGHEPLRIREIAGVEKAKSGN